MLSVCLPHQTAQHLGRCSQCPALWLAGTSEGLVSINTDTKYLGCCLSACPAPADSEEVRSLPERSQPPSPDRQNSGWILDCLRDGGAWARTDGSGSSTGASRPLLPWGVLLLGLTPLPQGVNSLRDPCTPSQLPQAKPSLQLPTARKGKPGGAKP